MKVTFVQKNLNKTNFGVVKKGCIWILLLFFSTTVGGCYMDVGPFSSGFKLSSTAASAGDSPVVRVHDTDVKGKTGLMSLVLYLYLISIGCDSNDAALVALAFFSVTQLELLPTVQADQPLSVATYMAKAAIIALSTPTLQVPPNLTRNQLIEAVITGLFKGVGEHNGYDLTSDEQHQLLQTFVGSAVSGIGESALFSDKKTAFAAISRSMISSLTVTEMTDEQYVTLAEQLMESATINVRGAGLNNATDIQDGLSSAMQAAITSLSAAGITDQTQLNEMIEGFSRGATTSLGKIGLTNNEQAAISAKIAEGTAQGMVDAGFATSEIETMKNKLQQQMTESLSASGVDSSSISAAQTAAGQNIDNIISGIRR